MFGRYKFSAADSAGVGATTDSKKFFLPLRRQTTSKWSWREFFVCADIIIHFGWLPSPPKEKRRRFFISPFRLRVTECSLFTVQFLVCPPPAAVPFALIRTSPLPSSVVGRGKPQKTFVAPTSGDRADVVSPPPPTNERTAGGRQTKAGGKGEKEKKDLRGKEEKHLIIPLYLPLSRQRKKAREPRSLPSLPRTFSGFFLRPIGEPRPILPRQKKTTSHYDRRRRAADAQIIMNKVPYALLASGQSEFVSFRW